MYNVDNTLFTLYSAWLYIGAGHKVTLCRQTHLQYFPPLRVFVYFVGNVAGCYLENTLDVRYENATLMMTWEMDGGSHHDTRSNSTNRTLPSTW